MKKTAKRKVKALAYREPCRGHFIAGVHVLRVSDGRHSSEGLQGLPAVQPARADAHRRVELVLVHLSVENHRSGANNEKEQKKKKVESPENIRSVKKKKT